MRQELGSGLLALDQHIALATPRCFGFKLNCGAYAGVLELKKLSTD